MGVSAAIKQTMKRSTKLCSRLTREQPSSNDLDDNTGRRSDHT